MKPYTYLISWTKQCKHYYGVKYAHDADPETFWKDYHTSSNYVKLFREQHGEPDVIKVDKTFDTVAEARAYEAAYLTEVNAVKSEQWLNKNNCGIEFGGCDKGRPCTWGDKISKAKKGQAKSAEHKAKLSNQYTIRCSNGMQWYFATTAEAKKNGIFDLTIKHLRKGPYRVKFPKKIAGTLIEQGAILTMEETQCKQSAWKDTTFDVKDRKFR